MIILEDTNLTKSNKLFSTGTTTVALMSKDAVVLAADRRSTMGYMISSKDVMKVLQIDDHIGLTIAGSVGDAQKLVRWMKSELSLYKNKYGKPASVKAASTFLSNILSNYKFYPFYVQLIVGGFDEKGPAVYTLDMGGGLEPKTDFFSTGSGSPYAFGVLEDGYKKDINLEEARKLAIHAIYTAQQRDIASGNGVTLVTISKEGYKYETYDRDEIRTILS